MEPILCLVRDLLFQSKITATAKHLNIEIKTLRDPAKLQIESGAWLIVDLNQESALDAAAEWRLRTGRPVVGFVSHVDTEMIATANAGEIDLVLPRSAFVVRLPRLLVDGPLEPI